jgi:hypothetical protein
MRCAALSLALLVALQLQQQAVLAVMLRFYHQECISREVQMYEPFYGSFVSQPGADYHTVCAHWGPQRTRSHPPARGSLCRLCHYACHAQAQYDLEITSPTGTQASTWAQAVFRLVQQPGAYAAAACPL